MIRRISVARRPLSLASVFAGLSPGIPKRPLWLVWASLWLAVPASGVWSQGSSALVPVSELNRYGMTRMWFTHAAVDSARGRVVQLKMHVSSKESLTAFEVVHDTVRYSYRETDVDSMGRVLGSDRARKMAEVKLSDLRSRQIEATPIRRSIPKITLYSVSDSGTIHAIDAETGRTYWKSSIGSPSYPTLGIDANDEYIAAINGSTVYVLKAANGEVAFERKTHGVPGAPPALSPSLVFVPMVNGLMEAYSLTKPQGPPSTFRSLGHAYIAPIFTGSYVAWPTDRGHLYVTGGEFNQINFRLEAKETIEAPASFLPPDRIVVSSTDGFVYCLHQTSGVLQWRFSTGEPIVSSPAPFGDTVYVATIDGTLFALNTIDGLERWVVGHVKQVLGASQTRLYCLNDSNRLTILDVASGAELGSLSTEQCDLSFLNLKTDRIVLGTSSGMLQCLREVAQDVPLVHIPLVTQEPAAKPRARRKPATGDAEAPASGPANPFESNPAPAAKPTADPFSTDPAGAAPAPSDTPATPAENPFGE
ncbi:MAG: PQQ-binding-like beta-propeller repeat protein [Pirellulaceae bacterium]